MTAVVTGASRGIGRATALALGERRVPLALIGRPSDDLSRAVSDVRDLGVTVEAFPCDLRDPEAISKAADRVLATFGAPAILVNNAGVVHRGPIEGTTLESWNEQLDVNLRAPYLLTRALLPSMRAAQRGRIVHVASISSTLGARNAAAYAASKWGLVGFMKSLAEEISGTGLMTCAILPGSVDTEMLQGSGFAPKMTAGHVAQTIVYHCLDAPLAHNGSVVEMFGV
jgi:3-oxoacyl-[acyl-carrier protein] reductase